MKRVFTDQITKGLLPPLDSMTPLCALLKGLAVQLTITDLSMKRCLR